MVSSAHSRRQALWSVGRYPLITTADVPRELATKREITVVPLTVTMEGQSYLDGVEIEPAVFYSRLARPGAFAFICASEGQAVPPGMRSVFVSVQCWRTWSGRLALRCCSFVPGSR